MDANRFDAIARTLSDPASRRTLLGIVIGAVSGLGPLAGLAKNKKKASTKTRKKKKRCHRECDGCCGGPDGFRCEPGLYVRACGKGGEECEDCSKSNRSCNDQRCCRHPGSECGFKGDCCDKSECRDQKCCIPGRNDCEKDCPQNGPCEQCCSGTCTDGHCCIAAGEACPSESDDDCCGEESLCVKKVCTADSCTPRCPDGIGDDPGMTCCSMTSDGHQNECMWDEAVNCRQRIIHGNLGLVGCPLYTNACCVGDDDGFVTCSGSETCQIGETKEPAVTCLT